MSNEYAKQQAAKLNAMKEVVKPKPLFELNSNSTESNLLGLNEEPKKPKSNRGRKATINKEENYKCVVQLPKVMIDILKETLRENGETLGVVFAKYVRKYFTNSRKVLKSDYASFRGGSDVKQTSIDITKDLNAEINAYCKERGIKKQHFAEAALSAYLRDRNK